MLSQDEWLSRYRARILHHQPDMSRELLEDYATDDTYQVMKLDFPADPELAVDIDPDLAYVHEVSEKKNAVAATVRRSPKAPEQED